MMHARHACIFKPSFSTGQGYVWLAHREIGSPAFALAARSKQMWGELLAPTVPELSKQAVEWQVGWPGPHSCLLTPRASQLQHANLAVSAGWRLGNQSCCAPPWYSLIQASGSMLLATSEAEGADLRQRRERLAAAGVEATALSAAEVHQLEPALATGAVHSGLLVPSDVQVNGKATAAALLRACEAHGPRFAPLFHEAAAELLTGPSGRVVGVATQARRCALQGEQGRAACEAYRNCINACPAATASLVVLHRLPQVRLRPAPACSVHAAHGVVVTLGAWSGGFLAQQLGDARWEGAFRPRRGLLLEMPRPQGMPAVRHGLMEARKGAWGWECGGAGMTARMGVRKCAFGLGVIQRVLP